MKITLPALKARLIDILGNAGFTDDLYIIIIHDDSVAVHFDQKEAVDYFRGDFENSDLAKDCIFEYRREGKRHAAYIYPW